MKKILHSSFFILHLLFVSCLLLSCHTTKASVSASEKSETVATSADRLCSSLMSDSFGQRFTLSVDSMFIILTEQGIVIVPEDRASPSLTAERLVQTRAMGKQLFTWPSAAESRHQSSMPSRDAGQGAASLDDMYFLSCRSTSGHLLPKGRKKHPANGNKSESDNKRSTAQRASALKIYGLHVDAGSNKKSNVQTLTTDSVAETTQSSFVKASDVRNSAPSTAPKYIFYILLLACALYLIYRFRHILRKLISD
jgi:hypothetical protein